MKGYQLQSFTGLLLLALSHDKLVTSSCNITSVAHFRYRHRTWRASWFLKQHWFSGFTVYFHAANQSRLSANSFRIRAIASHLKVRSATFLLVWLVCLTESTWETRKNVLYFTSKAFFILEIIMISSNTFHDLMPKYKTRNTFYWITWEVSTVW